MKLKLRYRTFNGWNVITKRNVLLIHVIKSSQKCVLVFSQPEAKPSSMEWLLVFIKRKKHWEGNQNTGGIRRSFPTLSQTMSDSVSGLCDFFCDICFFLTDKYTFQTTHHHPGLE